MAQMRRRIAKTTVAALSSLVLTACGATVRAGQRGLKYHSLQTPALEKTARPEGFYWLWPWNDMVTYDVTWQSRTENLDILTADDLHVSTKVTVTFRPQKDRIYELHTELGRAYYEDVVRPPFLAIARSEFARHRHNDLAREEPLIEGNVVEQLRGVIGTRPIDIDRVAISHVQYDPNVSQAISSKLATAQKVEQKEAEVKIAEREAEIARTTAKGRSDAFRIEAEGQAAAIVLRGDAQARAQSAITRTLTPNYLQYKAFDNEATRYYFVPVGKDGMPIIVNAESGGRSSNDYRLTRRGIGADGMMGTAGH